MSDDVTSSTDVKSRRACRTINNNIKFFKSRRRNRGRKKPYYGYSDYFSRESSYYCILFKFSTSSVYGSGDCITPSSVADLDSMVVIRQVLLKQSFSFI